MTGLIVTSSRHLIYLVKHKRYSPKKLLKDFDQKIWMTLGLGVTFFGFYYLIVLILKKTIDLSTGVDLFFLAYQQPIPFIYSGLFLFVLFSLLIYCVRSLVKLIYLNRKRK